MSPLPRFVLLYAGCTRPTVPEQLGLVLAGGTALRLLASPAAGRIGDRLRSLRPVLAFSLALAAAAAIAYLPAYGVWVPAGTEAPRRRSTGSAVRAGAAACLEAQALMSTGV